MLRAFLHYSALGLPIPKVILCSVCGEVLVDTADTGQDDLPLLMFNDNPICPKDALEKISEHPITPTYMKWLEEGDPRWWSPWFCDCDGCEPLARSDSAG